MGIPMTSHSILLSLQNLLTRHGRESGQRKHPAATHRVLAKRCVRLASSLFFALGLWLVVANHTLAQAQQVTDITVSFRFFDEAGNELSYDQTVNRMTNNVGSSALSTGTFDLGTLQALTLNTSLADGSGYFAVPFSALAAAPKQGLMVHWNTANTGYSSFLLDNQGLGFTQTQTLIFNETLAYDALRQFNDAYSRRTASSPPYSPSPAFTTLSGTIQSCISRLQAASTANAKGQIGQECVDYLAQAMALMLREYGTQRARSIEAQGGQPVTYGMWGVTTGDLTSGNSNARIDDLVALFEPRHRWARLMIDQTSDTFYAQARNVVNYAYANQVQTLGQLFDSSIQSGLSLAQFQDAVNRALAYPDFDKFTAWEVGNEVNGGWLGPDMTAKIEYAATRVKTVTGKPVCLTFYWYGMEDTLNTSLFNWISAHVTQTIVSNIDCVALSIYTDQQPLGFLWDLVMTKLASLFPGKMMLVGELGFVDPTVATYFREGPLDLPTLAGGQLYIQNRYPASFATPNTNGGDFWWYYDLEMAGRQPLWNTLHDVYCTTYKGYADVSHVCN